jgi:hypothetical protein
MQLIQKDVIGRNWLKIILIWIVAAEYFPFGGGEVIAVLPVTPNISDSHRKRE